MSGATNRALVTCSPGIRSTAVTWSWRSPRLATLPATCTEAGIISTATRSPIEPAGVPAGTVSETTSTSTASCPSRARSSALPT